MAWAVHAEWGKQVNKVKDELCEVALTIARYEPVCLLATPGRAFREAKRKFSASSNVIVIEAPVDDIWMRDIAPTFVLRQMASRRQKIIAIDWNFNGWGGTKHRPSRPGDRLAKTAADVFGVTRMSVKFIGEGGAFVTDGQGTMITTRSCLLNPNRNPSRHEIDRRRLIERELTKFDIRRVVWLHGDPRELITSGHADGYVLIAPSGVVLVEAGHSNTRMRDIDVLRNSIDASGQKLKLRFVLPPRRRYWSSDAETFAPCYLNAYVANGAVITACCGDPQRDKSARRAIAKAFPNRDVVMLRIDNNHEWRRRSALSSAADAGGKR